MLYVLKLMDGGYHVISQEQKGKIEEFIKSGQKMFDLGGNTIIVHQISGIPQMEVFKRQMQHSLAIKHQRMCEKCGLILNRLDKCPCRENPKKYPGMLDVARAENPELAIALDKIAAQKSLPPSSDGK